MAGYPARAMRCALVSSKDACHAGFVEPSAHILARICTGDVPVSENSARTRVPAGSDFIGLSERSTTSRLLDPSKRLIQRFTPLLPKPTRAWYEYLPSERSASEIVDPLPAVVAFSGQSVALRTESVAESERID